MQQTRAIRDYADAMRAAAEAAMLPPEHDLFAWLVWAERCADDLDPTKALTVPKDPDPHAEYRTAWSTPSLEPERSSWWQRPWYNR